MAEKQTLDYQLIPLDTLTLPIHRLRSAFSEVDDIDLTDSIREFGVLVPIIVRSNATGYTVIAGARRVRCARAAGLVIIPASIRTSTPSWEAWATLAENRLREPLNAFDEARFVSDLLRDTHLSQKELAALLGVGPNWVSQRVGLLDWPVDVKDAVAERNLGFAVARELAAIPDDASRAMYLEQAVRHGCTVRQASDWRVAAASVATPPSSPSLDEKKAEPGGLILGTPEVCGNCGASCVGVPALLLHLCEKCLTAMGKAMEPPVEVPEPPPIEP